MSIGIPTISKSHAAWPWGIPAWYGLCGDEDLAWYSISSTHGKIIDRNRKANTPFLGYSWGIFNGIFLGCSEDSRQASQMVQYVGSNADPGRDIERRRVDRWNRFLSSRLRQRENDHLQLHGILWVCLQMRDTNNGCCQTEKSMNTTMNHGILGCQILRQPLTTTYDANYQWLLGFWSHFWAPVTRAL